MLNNLIKDDSTESIKDDPISNWKGSTSIFSFFHYELTRDYLLEHDEEKYSARRQKVYSFMKIPKEIEKFMVFGFMQCIDSFLFVCTFLPIRVAVAVWALLTKPACECFGFKAGKKLTPAKICDLLRAIILIIGSIVMCYIDPNVLYHVIKSQSIMKLYIFFNMLEVGDRLFSSIGQDAIDALFWTATEPKGRKREHLGIIAHLIFATGYVILHSILVMLQATTLNVAINSSNKGLLTIMLSNNFLELKGSVFKKFDKNNLFQLSCSDIRERFHWCFLLFVVVMQTMKEYSWESTKFFMLLPDCIVFLLMEVWVDWLKHAFVTKFNDLTLDIYKDYTVSLAYDMAQTRQKHAFTDCCDVVARRMGFIPLPLGVVLIRILIATLPSDYMVIFRCFLIYIILVQFKILNSIIAMGKACNLIDQHKQDKALIMSPLNVKTFTNKDATGEGTNETPITSNTTQKKNNHINFVDEIQDVPIKQNDLGSAAIFANSTVDLKNATLNDEILKADDENMEIENLDNDIITRSFPNINANFDDAINEDLKRAESEPALNSCNNREEDES